MKKSFLYSVTTIVIAVLFSTITFAQNERTVSAAGERYIISAEAGGVNYVEGKVTLRKNNGRSDLLIKGDAIQVGDKVSTGSDGRAEVLLNPGSYIRLGENSDFEFNTTSLDDLQLQLNRGSAMFEVITSNDFTFAVNTPNTNFYILKSGVYRIDVLGDGSGKIAVWKGLAQVGEDNANIVKSGREAIDDDDLAVAKFDRGDKDELEAWSKTRAKELAKNNSKFQRRDLRNSLVNSYGNRGWDLFGSYGLWVFNPYYGGYCFLPFGYGWSSPYGYGYGYDLWTLRMPRYIYMQPPPRIIRNPPGTINSDSGTGIKTRIPRSMSEVPPFAKVQRDIGRSPVQMDSNPGFLDGPGFPSRGGSRSTFPSSSTPTAAPSELGSPATVPTRGRGN